MSTPQGHYIITTFLSFLGGALQRVSHRRRLPNETPVPAAKAQFGSTATLTEAGGSNNGDAEEGSENSSNGGYWYGNGNGANGDEGASLGSDADYNSDSEFTSTYNL